MVVLVLGVVLASLASILLLSTGRDRAEARQQTSSARAVYASEAAVAVGIEHLRGLLEAKTAPTAADFAELETQSRTTLATALSGATYPVFNIRYYDASRNIVSESPTSSSSALVTIAEGANKGLRAQQTPIQVLATARVDNASATVADAIRVDLIPVFQFAIFFDGDLEFQRPAPMSVSGRVHTNGDLYLSNGNQVNFLSTVTAAGKVHSHAAVSTAETVGSGSTATRFTRASDSALIEIARNLPLPDLQQETYLDTTWGVDGGLQDRTTGVEPLSIPLRLSSSTTCASDAACGTGRSCVKVRTTDDLGVCTNNVVSRPSQCGNGSRAEFAQSLAIELVKRPRADYANNAAAAPYRTDFDRVAAVNPARTSPYASDFGPRTAIVRANATTREPNDIIEISVPRRVPRVTSSIADDDPGAVVDRMYWKAHIRIIDGIWYRDQSPEPIFDPEVHAPGTTNPNATTDLSHAFARVLRYAWWWDVRENRVYCETAGNQHCVSDGNEFQRGLQIRATDFDMAAFMALLERPDARARLFAGGVVPDGGIILYISETYDPAFEDANTQVDRAANVRNLLNFPIMHNHLTPAAIATTSGALTGLVRSTPPTSITNDVIPPPLTPHQLGWFPENLWGRNVSTINFESLTRPSGADDAAFATFYANPAGTFTNPSTTASKVSSTCVIPGTEFTSSRRPSTRPSTFSSARVPPTCLQAGAQPLGPENAVRLIRAQTVPLEGFTLVTDNRFYVHGDVNVRTNSTVESGTFATSQDVGGKIALIADSLTIQSEAFDDRRHQGGNGASALNFQSFHQPPTAYPNDAWTTAPDASRALPYSTTASGGGGAANICNVVRNVPPFETRINASLLMGDVPACLGGGSGMGSPSGGVNNFPRFVERWDGIDLVINGSMVGLFRSERGNARFLAAATTGTGIIRESRSGSAYPDGAANICDYRPPNRKWTFDQVLLSGLDKLPPGTPRVVANQRLRWVRR
jgi:hypothetical protein